MVKLILLSWRDIPAQVIVQRGRRRKKAVLSQRFHEAIDRAAMRAGKQVMHIVRRLRDELKVNTTCGASNVSFGLPNRNGINSAFLTR